ncbi:unnamed protein product [Chilo suppressalis]|uniref:Odorant receptor n=1 Tax=Chilo suppressalis TaxID=168631 RepID=A0ABN8LCN6_CHISP|nr:unnamed protein product [Chilo suppressalis]
MNCFSSTIVPLSKYIFMHSSSFRLSVIMKMSRQGMLSLPEGSTAHATMRRVLRKASFVSWMVILNQAFIHVFYMILPFVMTIFGSERYLPTTPGDIYGISSKYQSPNYEITFTLTCVAAMFSAFNQTVYIVLFVTLLSHELGHFYAICDTFNDIHKILHDKQHTKEQNNDHIDSYVSENDKHKKVEELIRFCLKHHQYLFRYHHRICDLYKGIFGVHFLIMIIVLVTTLQTLNSWGIMNTILTGVTGIMPLMVYCFGGEMLINAGTDMSFAIYSCGWEEMKIKHARMIQLMLCLSQHPLCYTAVGIFVMNHDTFGNVAQVIYKIYAVFN